MEDYHDEMREMLNLTRESVEELTSVWLRTFDRDICQDNLHRLYEHAKNFYDDLVTESLQKQTYIEEEISRLKTEAENLQRLLKTEVKLPEIIEDDKVPLMVIQKEMDKSLTDLREQLRLRREQICDLLLEQESLCEELGEATRSLLADPLPTAGELEDFRNYLDNLKEERVRRMQELVNLRREIKRDLQILEINISTEADDRLLNHRQIELTMETFESLNKMREHFREQVEELKMRIDGIRQKLPSLWDRLNTPYEERRKIERHNEYDQKTYDMLYMELERCEEIKRQNLKPYIQKIRHEIEFWWNKTLKSDLQRSRFTNFNNNNYTDELLTLCEMELEDLKQYYETNEQIFQLFADRKVLWERMISLEQKACDPARYNNRGGQLLQEEKERKTIATKLPKIEKQIKELVMAFQEREHAPFLVYGEDILEIMESEWKKKREEKEAMSTARKNAVTPQSHGPNRSQIASGQRTPLMQRSASTVTLCKTSSTKNLSTTKRTNIISSAQKRKLNPSEKTTPVAKRSLWNSPGGVFLKPTTTVKGNVNRAPKSPNQRKKLPRVIATTIRRRSGRLSANGALKKRRSLNKSGRNHPKIPQVIVSEACTSDDENYDVFKNSISPDSRSSIRYDPSVMTALNHKTTKTVSRAMKQRQENDKLTTIEEKKRIATLPRPQIPRTPSKQNIREYPLSPGAGSSSILSSNRKLTTKNLPIII